MKGLTHDQLREVIEFAQEHHKFAKWKSDAERAIEKELYPKLPEYGFNIKYIDTCYDSRYGDFWSINFRFGAAGICFRTNHWTSLNPPPKGWKYDNLYDLCMAYLKGEFVPKDEFYFDERK